MTAIKDRGGQLPTPAFADHSVLPRGPSETGAEAGREVGSAGSDKGGGKDCRKEELGKGLSAEGMGVYRNMCIVLKQTALQEEKYRNHNGMEGEREFGERERSEKGLNST